MQTLSDTKREGLVKIAILGGYGPIQSVGAVKRAFERAGHDVWHVPTLPRFGPNLLDAHGDVPDLLFTFKIGLQHVPLGHIKGMPIKTKVFWSFDDPHWVDTCTNKELNWAREHDLVLTSCQESLEAYKEIGIRACFLPPAMDTEYYKPWQEASAVDLRFCSFICTTLYPPKTFPDNLIDRSKMVDRLTATFGKRDFGLFGYNKEIEAKPAWVGPVTWETTLPQMIQGTRMNINNHLTAKKRLYFNERFFQIVATKRAMFVDRVNGFVELLAPDNFVFYSSLDELCEKLVWYCHRSGLLASIGERGFDRMRGWTYDEFVKQVLIAAEGGDAKPSFL